MKTSGNPDSLGRRRAHTPPPRTPSIRTRSWRIVIESYIRVCGVMNVIEGFRSQSRAGLGVNSQALAQRSSDLASAALTLMSMLTVTDIEAYPEVHILFPKLLEVVNNVHNFMKSDTRRWSFRRIFLMRRAQRTSNALAGELDGLKLILDRITERFTADHRQQAVQVIQNVSREVASGQFFSNAANFVMSDPRFNDAAGNIRESRHTFTHNTFNFYTPNSPDQTSDFPDLLSV